MRAEAPKIGAAREGLRLPAAAVVFDRADPRDTESLDRGREVSALLAESESLAGAAGRAPGVKADAVPTPGVRLRFDADTQRAIIEQAGFSEGFDRPW